MDDTLFIVTTVTVGSDGEVANGGTVYRHIGDAEKAFQEELNLLKEVYFMEHMQHLVDKPHHQEFYDEYGCAMFRVTLEKVKPL